jgi:hypothetical protein
MNERSKGLAALAVAGALTMGSVGTQAALFDRGGGMIYDSDLNITWLQDWNVNGLMLWDQANSWAEGLTVGGFTDWRLPVAADTWCQGYGCASELAHMFYDVFGGTSGKSVLSGANTANLSMFVNIQDDLEPSFAAYWMGTEDVHHPGYHKELWMIDAGGGIFGGGVQGATGDPERLYAVAVRPGDVISAAPEPETWALMLLGLGAMAGLGRRTQRRACSA